MESLSLLTFESLPDLQIWNPIPNPSNPQPSYTSPQTLSLSHHLSSSKYSTSTSHHLHLTFSPQYHLQLQLILQIRWTISSSQAWCLVWSSISSILSSHSTFLIIQRSQLDSLNLYHSKLLLLTLINLNHMSSGVRSSFFLSFSLYFDVWCLNLSLSPSIHSLSISINKPKQMKWASLVISLDQVFVKKKF